MLTLVAAIVVFGVLIFFHELGHFMVAKRVGVGVIEFALGFGPRLISTKAGDTIYSLRVFPLGGFVRLVGEDADESDAENSFQNKSVWARFSVIAAGPIMNFVLAVLLFSTIYFAFLGIPLYQSTTLGGIIPGGQAEVAQLQKGDKILAIQGQPVSEWQDVVSLINANPEKEITIEYERQGTVRTITVVPEKDSQTGTGRIGIQADSRKYAFFPSIRYGLEHTVMFVRMFIVNIAQMITGQMAPDVVGPVGIIQFVGEAAKTGMMNLMNLAAIISLNLGIFNLLPIPALDGSRLLFLAVEGVRGRPVDPKKESFIHFVGFTVLIFLMIVIAWRDLARLNLFF
jgi:regulator of sigma E protease